MSGFAKGGLFVGAAVTLGLLAGFLLPQLVTGNERGRGSSGGAPPLPTMPSVVGQSLGRAEAELGRRDIAYVTDADEIFGVVVPSVWEVCGTDPPPGGKVSGTARVRAALPGTCSL